MIKRKNLLFVISAPSGTGKTTVSAKILKVVDGLVPSVSLTTRPPRDGEVDGKDYIFTTKEEFEKKIKAKELVEWNEYNGNYYGSSLENIENAKQKGKDLLFVIEVNGAQNIKKIHNNGVYIFIMPPSISVLRDRLLRRGAETPEAVEARINIARQEIPNFANYDYVVVNHQIDETAKQISAIMHAERCRQDNITVNLEDE